MDHPENYFGDEVRRRRRALNLTQAELGAMTDPPLSQATIADIERHRNRSSRYLVQLAKALGCDARALTDPKLRGLDLDQTSSRRIGRVNDDLNQRATMPLSRKVPVIPWARVEWWEKAVAVSRDEVWTTADAGPRAFALVVTGDAMASVIPDGAAVIVDPDTQAKHRSIVVVQRPGEAPILRRLWYDGGVPQLRAESPGYPLLSFPDGTRIIGVAVSYTVSLR